MRKFFVPAVAALLALLTLAACSSSAPTHFYLLSSLPERPAPSPGHGVAIGVGPVTLPQYLNRPQIVTRSSDNRLIVSEFDQWGGALDDNVARTMADSLATLLGTDRVSLYPWKESAPVDYQVTVDITAFEAGADGTAVLSAFWSVIDARTNVVATMRRSSYSANAGAPATGGDLLGASRPYDAIVGAMSQDLQQLSHDIAAAIAGLRSS